MPPKKRPNNETIEFDLANVCESEFSKSIQFIAVEDQPNYSPDDFKLHTQQQKEIFNAIQRRIKRLYKLDPNLLDNYNKEYKKTWGACKTPTQKNYQKFIDAYNKLKQQLIKLVAEKKETSATDSESDTNNNNNAVPQTVTSNAPTNIHVTNNTTTITNVHNNYAVNASIIPPPLPMAVMPPQTFYNVIMDYNIISLCNYLLANTYNQQEIEQALQIAETQQFIAGQKLLLMYQRLFQLEHTGKNFAEIMINGFEALKDNNNNLSPHVRNSFFHQSNNFVIDNWIDFLTQNKGQSITDLSKELFRTDMTYLQPLASYMSLMKKFVAKVTSFEETAAETLSQQFKRPRTT